MTDVDALVELVAEGSATPIGDVAPDATLDDAYAVRDGVLARRVAAGDALRGVKLGGTPPTEEGAPWGELAAGWLTASMIVPTDTVLDRGSFVRPYAEPEMAFVLRDEVRGPGVTMFDVLDATERIHGAIEIMDVRSEGPHSAVDVVARNISAAHAVVGTRAIPGGSCGPDVDLSLLGCLFERDGRAVGTASGAAVLGHPAAAIAALANAVAARGESLQAGWIVLAGGLLPALDASTATSLTAVFSRLGRVGCAFH